METKYKIAPYEKSHYLPAVFRTVTLLGLERKSGIKLEAEIAIMKFTVALHEGFVDLPPSR